MKHGPITLFNSSHPNDTNQSIYITHTHTHIDIYTIYRVSRGNVPDFGRMFLTLKYTDITQNTYVYPKLNGYGDNGERSLKV